MKLPEEFHEKAIEQSTQTDDISQITTAAELLIETEESSQTEIDELPIIKTEFLFDEPPPGDAQTIDVIASVEEEILDESSLKVECEYCNERFNNDLELTSHHNRHSQLLPYILGSIEFFRCSRCLLVFPRIDDLAKHFDSNAVCEAPKDFDRIDYQYLDDIDVTESPIRLFSCFQNTGNLQYTCDMCLKDFHQLNEFRRHFNDLHLENAEQNIGYLLVETPHVCGLCSKISGNLKSALHHVFFHQAELRCPIENCSTAVMGFSDLYEHTADEHEQVLVGNIRCTHCHYKVKSKEELKEHKQKSCAARNFECNDCGKMFLRRNTLAMHLRTHTREKRHHCEYCDKSFFQSIDLNNHVR